MGLGPGNPLLKEELRDGAAVLSLLAHARANLHAKNAFGRTPAHCAALCRNVDALEVLFAYGADFEAKGKDGLTVVELLLGLQKDPPIYEWFATRFGST